LVPLREHQQLARFLTGFALAGTSDTRAPTRGNHGKSCVLSTN
jgi:hypothetical protein